MTVSAEDIGARSSHLGGVEPRSVPPRFLKSLATVLGGQAACAVVALGIEICYARLLGPAGRGQISLGMMVIAIGAVLGGLGGEVPIMIWSANEKETTAQWLPAVSFWGMVGCAAVSGLWGLVYWRWHPIFLRGMTTPIALLVLATIPLSVLIQYLVALFTGMERFRQRAGLALVSQVAELIAVVALTSLVARTAEMAVLGNWLGLLAAGCVGAYLARECLRNWWNLAPAAGRLYGALSLGLRGQFGNLATFFTYRLDIFVVNYFLEPAQVGFYALGVVISESLWQIPHAVAVALFPRTARTLDQGAEAFTCFVTRQVFLLASLLGLVIALASPVVVPMVFGARFGPSVPVIWWILPGTVALAVGKVMSADLTARGKPEYNSIIALATLGATALLDFTLIPRMGIRGAALASSITYSLETILVGSILRHFLKVSWKSLCVPASSDLESYRHAWLSCRSWLKSVTTPGKQTS
jgi:O-antigen/teichoic acid export membrane protein